MITNSVTKNMLMVGICIMLFFVTGCKTDGNNDSTTTESGGDLDSAVTEQKSNQNKQEGEPVIHSDENGLAEANKHFAFQLFDSIVQADEGENVFLSPFSIGMVLSMVYNGADAGTKTNLEEALFLQNIGMDDVNQSYKLLHDLLVKTESDVTFEIANSLWGKKGIQFNKGFLQKSKQYYDALITEADFTNPQTAKEINRWITEKTKGKIKKIIDGNIDPLTILFLNNAVYFKGKWMNPFDANMTEKDAFFLSDGTVKMVPMMSQTGNYAYLETEGFQAIKMPYGDERFGMTLFLPNTNSNLEQFQQQLNVQKWDEWMASFEMAPGSIQLPRFKMEYEKQLNDTLKSMGLDMMFAKDQADFSQMLDGPDNAYVDEVRHATFIEVNEEGTEAAGTTSVEMDLPREPFDMHVDRPFFFVIQDDETNTILFMGSVWEVLE